MTTTLTKLEAVENAYLALDALAARLRKLMVMDDATMRTRVREDIRELQLVEVSDQYAIDAFGLDFSRATSSTQYLWSCVRKINGEVAKVKERLQKALNSECTDILELVEMASQALQERAAETGPTSNNKEG